MLPIVIDPHLAPEIKTELQTRRPNLRVHQPDDLSTLGDVIDDVGKPLVFMSANSQWNDDYLQFLAEGDWIVTRTTGHENFPIASFRSRGIIFSNLPGSTVKAIAEHVFGLLFTVSRRLRTYHEQQKRRVWERQIDGMTDFDGDICTIVGLGRIGEEVAIRAAAFGMAVRGVKRTIEGYDGAADELYSPEQLHAALSDAKIVVLAVPLNEETEGLIGSQELECCADNAIIINVARGPVLDTTALVEALNRNKLRAACVDVADKRPPPREWPLWNRDDVVVTPHVAGQSDKAYARLVDLFLSEYDLWQRSKQLHHRIT